LGAEDTVVLGQADDGNDGWFVTCPRLDVGTTVG